MNSALFFKDAINDKNVNNLYISSGLLETKFIYKKLIFLPATLYLVSTKYFQLILIYICRIKRKKEISVSLEHEKEMKLGKQLLKLPEVITRLVTIRINYYLSFTMVPLTISNSVTLFRKQLLKVKIKSEALSLRK